MSLMGRDMRRNHAPGCYLPVYDWSKIQEPFGSNNDCVSYVFSAVDSRLTDILGHLYFEFQALNPNYDPTESDSQQYIKQTLDAGISVNSIIADYINLYGERPFAQLYYFDKDNPNSNTGNQETMNRLRGKLAAVIDLNYFKYKRLAETLGFVYDPISNYDMTERGTDKKTYNGKEKLEHEVDGKKITGVEVFGPLASSDIDTTEDAVKNLTITIDANRKIATDQTGVSDVRAGRAAASIQTSGIDAIGTVDTQAAGIPTTNHYTTTMDDPSTGRLQNYDTTTGDTAQSMVAKVETEMPATGHITAGSPNSPSYTDTKTYSNRNDENEHSLTRSGNIGVTTSQQMIESERQLVRFSLLREIFEDINKELLLSVWD